ncbi:unnamed protein product [Rangifer tarandus platyrhynchus]|uniref:Uncharacterized protein n=1 Tax=Rangifer tarandus platyrhynchus TaxID=3082113 RepID=A0ABN8Y5U1_RANTA|nr:unnamed protein product [Rangifer tarandus platyrhynchus]
MSPPWLLAHHTFRFIWRWVPCQVATSLECPRLLPPKRSSSWEVKVTFPSEVPGAWCSVLSRSDLCHGGPPPMGWLYSSALSSTRAVILPDSGVPSGLSSPGWSLGLEAQPNPLGFLRRHRQFPGLDAGSGVGPGEEQASLGPTVSSCSRVA